MEKFIVSALKYRPQNFNTVIGQKHITTTLKNAIAHNTLAHAFLFCGPRGVGKTTCARILAKTINCENLQPDGEACNTCQSCTSFNNGSSLNIHELDAASNNSVDDIRDLVVQVRFAPQHGKFKIYIIDEVHMLSASAFNAFLKTLEEPPPYAKFILATTEKHKILPTILSRCQIFDFKRITNADTVEHLQEITDLEKINAEKAALQIIAQKSEGCMRDALSLLDKIVSFTDGQVSYSNTVEHLNLLDEDQYFQLLEALALQDIGSTLLLYDAIYARGFEGDMVLNGFAEVLRNLLICKDKKAAKLLDVVEGLESRYTEMAETLSFSFLVSALQVLNDAEIGYRNAKNKRLQVELALIKLCYLQQAIEMAATPDGKVVKKSRLDGPVAVREKVIPPLISKPKKEIKKAQIIIEKQESQGAAFLIETKKEAKSEEQESVTSPLSTNFEKAPKKDPQPPLPTDPAQIQVKKKTSLLKSLQTEILQKNELDPIDIPVRMPVQEEVDQVWGEFIEKLKVAERHSIITSFQMAKLIVSDQLITVQIATKLNQRIIEAEGSDILSIMKKQFNNYDITLAYRVMESESDGEKKVEPKYLNSTERFHLMSSEYPIVLELKEKLKLDLGYS